MQTAMYILYIQFNLVHGIRMNCVVLHVCLKYSIFGAFNTNRIPQLKHVKY